MMDTPPFLLLINQIDELMFVEIGEHLDDLQYHILEGALNQLKYKEIAKKNRRSEKYVKDVAGKLWQTLSEIFGKKVSKKNIKSSLQRYYYANFVNEKVGNTGQINKGNICTNPPEEKELSEGKEYIEFQLNAIEQRHFVIANLIQEGLTAEQIARVFKLPLKVVQQQIDKV